MGLSLPRRSVFTPKKNRVLASSVWHNTPTLTKSGSRSILLQQEHAAFHLLQRGNQLLAYLYLASNGFDNRNHPYPPESSGWLE
jgi:hypothetical protein